MAIENAILPLNQARITAGYKNPAYKTAMGFGHFGIDMADDNRTERSVFAPFTMKITHAGYDDLMGYTIIGVSVNSIDIHNGLKAGTRRLAIRMAHLDAIYVKAGDIVKPEGNAIAIYGGTGIYGGGSTNRHLHVEVDTDIDYPNYSPTPSASANDIWRGGFDTTVHPMDVFKVDALGDRGVAQKFYYAIASGNWVLADDKATLDLKGNLVIAKGL